MYLNIVECGKWIGNEMEYSHAERVMYPLDDVAQLAYPMEVPSYKWYPNLLRPQDWVGSSFTLVANHSRIIIDLNGIPENDRRMYHDFACTRIVKVVCWVKEECDLIYTVAIRLEEDI